MKELDTSTELEEKAGKDLIEKLRLGEGEVPARRGMVTERQKFQIG